MNKLFSIDQTQTQVIPKNKVLTNTYNLLALTLLWSAAVAGISMALQLPQPGLILTMVAYFASLFAIYKFSHSSMGIFFVFIMTGILGYTLGPMLSALLSLNNGTALIMTSLGMTGIAFLGLSAFVLTTKKDFSFLEQMLFIGIVVGFFCGLISYFFNLPALGLAVSAMFVLLMCGLILTETSRIVNGGQTNYILATVTLYVAIYNLFVSLLHLLSFFTNQE